MTTRTVAEIDVEMDANLEEFMARGGTWEQHPDLAAKHNVLQHERNIAAGYLNPDGTPSQPRLRPARGR